MKAQKPARAVDVPAGLADRGAKLWSDVMTAYVLDPGETTLLLALARAVDVEDRLTVEAAGAPVTVEGSRGQPVPHPIFGMLRAQVKVVEGLERSLALPQPGQTVGQRRHAGAQHAANVRWNRGKGA